MARKSYKKAARAATTKRGYSSDWRQFEKYCERARRISMPAKTTTVCAYLRSLADGDKAFATIKRHYAAIRWHHKQAGHPCGGEEVNDLLSAVARTIGVRQEAKKALTLEQIKQMVDKADLGSVSGLRDAALLLIGFAGAFRRDELVNLRWSDVEWIEGGVRITLEKSKTDQMKIGRVVGIPRGDSQYCPVTALERWRGCGTGRGLVFRGVSRYGKLSRSLSGGAVGKIVKSYCGLVGLEAGAYGAHSLRAGFVTEAHNRGIGESAIMSQTGHTRVETLRRYIRNEDLGQNPGKGMF
tara:strand:- start:791 stop:1681 length:891 start_codon:yes stop_codon:yes gene_type:complete